MCRFAIRTKTDNDAFGAYLHGGRIGVLTVVEGSTDEEAAETLLCISLQSTLNMFLLNKLAKKKSTTKEVLKQQALNEGKPENIVEKWWKDVYVNTYKKFVL